MLIKIGALGFYSADPNRGSYISDNWNKLDFTVVMFSLIDFLPIDNGPIRMVRIVRVLRPLRTLNKIPELRFLIALLVTTISGLGDVLLFILLIFIVFAILGVQLFNGLFHNRCSDPDTGNLFYPADGTDYICSIPPNNGLCKLKIWDMFHPNTDSKSESSSFDQC